MSDLLDGKGDEEEAEEAEGFPMTDAELNRAPKTDAEIARLVAEARGWTKCTCGDPDCPYWTATNGTGQTGKVCSDPSAWGALHDELRAQGWRIEMTSGAALTTVLLRHWGPGPKKEAGEATDSSTGRALAEAFLRSKGVL